MSDIETVPTAEARASGPHVFADALGPSEAASDAVEPVAAAGPRLLLTARRLMPERIVLGLLGLVLFLVAWEVATARGMLNPLFSSSPSRIGPAAVDYVSSPEFLRDLAASSKAFAYGLALGVVVGIPGGLLMGWFRRVGYLFAYLVDFLYATPRVALVPALLLTFGIGIESKIAIVFLMTVFPMIINTITGVRTVDHGLLRVGYSLSASNWQLFRTIILPASIPSIVAGVRLAISLGIVGVVVSEFLASSSGVGYMMKNAADTFQADKVFVGLMIFAASGVLLNELVGQLEKRADRWRPSQHLKGKG